MKREEHAKRITGSNSSGETSGAGKTNGVSALTNDPRILILNVHFPKTPNKTTLTVKEI